MASTAQGEPGGARYGPGELVRREREVAELRTVAAICSVLGSNPPAVELAAHQLAHQLARHPLGTLAELPVHGECPLDGPDPGRPGKRSLREPIGAGYAG
ncbi:hypothetical protein ABZX40_39390 [Streptomyces sp. NPDC004610]|uniref:hypothetical protein n=1 Tax=unclassified Streptomyces TaxID=2593676 RepID=UPI0033A121E6